MWCSLVYLSANAFRVERNWPKDAREWSVLRSNLMRLLRKTFQFTRLSDTSTAANVSRSTSKERTNVRNHRSIEGEKDSASRKRERKRKRERERERERKRKRIHPTRIYRAYFKRVSRGVRRLPRIVNVARASFMARAFIFLPVSLFLFLFFFLLFQHRS